MSPHLWTRRPANLIIGIFLAIQLCLLLWAALPLPEPYRGSWPWAMFDRRGKFEKHLEAIGITPTGLRRALPLDEIFQYRRGFTPLRAYDQVSALNKPSEIELHKQFARFLAERMSERGVRLDTIEIAWIRRNLDTGRTQRRPIGTFRVGEEP